MNKQILYAAAAAASILAAGHTQAAVVSGVTILPGLVSLTTPISALAANGQTITSSNVALNGSSLSMIFSTSAVGTVTATESTLRQIGTFNGQTFSLTSQSVINSKELSKKLFLTDSTLAYRTSQGTPFLNASAVDLNYTLPTTSMQESPLAPVACANPNLTLYGTNGNFSTGCFFQYLNQNFGAVLWEKTIVETKYVGDSKLGGQSSFSFDAVYTYANGTAGPSLNGIFMADGGTADGNFSTNRTTGSVNGLNFTNDLYLHVTSSTFTVEGYTIPAPATLSLMGLSLLGLAGIKRRRR